MAERKTKRIEVERERGEKFDTLHLRVRVPKLLPEQAERHVRSAEKELLLAVRSIFDELVERLEKPEAKEERGSGG